VRDARENVCPTCLSSERYLDRIMRRDVSIELAEFLIPLNSFISLVSKWKQNHYGRVSFETVQVSRKRRRRRRSDYANRATAKSNVAQRTMMFLFGAFEQTARITKLFNLFARSRKESTRPSRLDTRDHSRSKLPNTRRPQRSRITKSKRITAGKTI